MVAKVEESRFLVVPCLVPGSLYPQEIVSLYIVPVASSMISDDMTLRCLLRLLRTWQRTVVVTLWRSFVTTELVSLHEG